jgi:hypothetical protein
MENTFQTVEAAQQKKREDIEIEENSEEKVVLPVHQCLLERQLQAPK